MASSSYINYDDLLSQSPTDKESLNGHRYGIIYDLVINSLKSNRKLSVLEVGVQRGWSLVSYCKSGDFDKVVGLDIEPILNQETEEVLAKYGSYIWQLDAYKKSTIEFLLAEYGHFDLIIDDGSHLLHDQMFFIKEYYRLLSDNGIMICEDVRRNNVMSFRSLRGSLGVKIIDMRLMVNNLRRRNDDEIIVMRRKVSEE